MDNHVLTSTVRFHDETTVRQSWSELFYEKTGCDEPDVPVSGFEFGSEAALGGDAAGAAAAAVVAAAPDPAEVDGANTAPIADTGPNFGSVAAEIAEAAPEVDDSPAPFEGEEVLDDVVIVEDVVDEADPI